jgi:transcriptional regulator GlxA family with amidase domain
LLKVLLHLFARDDGVEEAVLEEELGALEATDDSVEQIAERTGMGTGATLRRHFHRSLGVPPDAYRRTFHDR